MQTNWKEQFTTVTPVSKYLATFLFFLLPMVGFLLGVQYGASQGVMSAEGVVSGEHNRYSGGVMSGDTVPSCDEMPYGYDGVCALTFDKPERLAGCDELLYEDSIDNCYYDNAVSKQDDYLCFYIEDSDVQSQCFDRLKGEEVEKPVLYALSSYPDAVAVGEVTPITFLISYAGTEAEAEVTVFQVDMSKVDKNPEVVATVGLLNDAGQNGDLVADDGVYSGTFEVGPFAKEQEVHYRARVTFLGNLDLPEDYLMTEVFALKATEFPVPPNNASEEFVTDQETDITYVPNQLLVGFVDGTPPDKVREIVSVMGGEVIGGIYSLDVYLVNFSQADTLAELRTLMRDFESYAEVEYAEVNHKVDVDSSI